ncbi:MAG: YdcF family protein [Clostridia bacterium]|nr:YdcF family protein [Clostridia bacterium]
MKNVVRQVALLGLALLLVCVLGRLVLRNTYVDRIPVTRKQGTGGEMRLVSGSGQQDVVDPGAPQPSENGVQVALKATQPGEAWYEVRDASGRRLSTQHYRVGRFLTVYDYDTGGFTGDALVMVALTVFWLGTAFIMLRAFHRTRGTAFYAYDTIYYVGFGLFTLVTGAVMLNLTLRRLIQPREFTMLDVYSALSGAGFNFMMVTLPALVVFAVAMIVSNIALLFHEQARLKNLLGLLVGLTLLAGEALAIYLQSRNLFHSPRAFRAQIVAQDVYCTVFAYFECMLIGAAACGLLAAKHVPSGDRDFIIILGCGFRKDGSLSPLLRGRVDRALAFWRDQQSQSGRTAVLVPSGGQGSDETMPEAEAMRRYLVEQGVPGDKILPEDRSTNTFQNMAYSKVLIDASHPGGKVAFATTNYHVFRSGVWARLAGLEAEGMGARTIWWHWPNAFMRECAGLLARRWRQELVMVAAMALFFGALSVAVTQ